VPGAERKVVEPIRKGKLIARLAHGRGDMVRVLAFRRAAFPRIAGEEEDAQDALSAHVMVEGDGRLLAYFRLMLFGWGAGLEQGYAARFYDVGPLSGYARPIAEMGRFCVAPGGVHPDVLRLAWGAMTRLVDEGQAGLIVGCTSFRGADWTRHREGLALLAAEFVGPKEHLPGGRRGRWWTTRLWLGRWGTGGPHSPVCRRSCGPIWGWEAGSAITRWWTGSWTRSTSSPASRSTGCLRRG
jgi:hypothetical protein